MNFNIQLPNMFVLLGFHKNCPIKYSSFQDVSTFKVHGITLTGESFEYLPKGKKVCL
jgi:hypothetical protein